MTDTEKETIKEAIRIIVNNVHVMNIAANLCDQGKPAAAWMVTGSEIQRALLGLDKIGWKHKSLREFIKAELESKGQKIIAPAAQANDLTG